MRRITAAWTAVLVLICSMNVYASDLEPADTGSVNTIDMPEEKSGTEIKTEADQQEEPEAESKTELDQQEPETGLETESGQQNEPETEIKTEPEHQKEPETELKTKPDQQEEPEATAETEQDQEKDVFYRVSLPADSRVYLDPGNLSGRGQIFSDSCQVENYGNTDIAIKIKNIDIYYQFSESIYEFSKDAVTGSLPSVKRLQVDMIWKNEDEDTEKVLNICEGAPEEYVLFLKAANYDENGEFISVAEGGRGSFSFTGTVNSNPNLIWEDGEITVSFRYEIVNMEEKSDEVTEDNMSQEEKESMNETPVPVQEDSASQQDVTDHVQNIEDFEKTNQESLGEQTKEPEHLAVSDNDGDTDSQEDTEHQGETSNYTEGVEQGTAENTESLEISDPSENAEKGEDTKITDIPETTDYGSDTEEKGNLEGSVGVPEETAENVEIP